MKVYITRPIPKIGIDMLKKAGHKVTLQPKPIDLPAKELAKKVKGVNGILSLLSNKIDEQIIKAAGSELKVISNYAVGFDNIDLEAAKKRNIVVCNTPCPEVVNSVAEHTFALILALSRKIVAADKFSRAKKYHGWDPMLFIGQDINNKTLGILGLGAIGKGVVKRAYHGFGMKIVYNDIVRDLNFEKEFNATYLTREEVLAQSDIISLHVPLLESTRKMINSKTLKLMKKEALLINTARGPIVDSQAVVQALSKNKLGGYAFDVFECEPKIACDTTTTKQLIKMDNVIMTPHIASATIQARDAMAVLATQGIIDALAGKEPKNIVKH